jgi:serine/threonine-protein kinase
MVDPGDIGDEAQPGLRPGTRLGKYEIVRLLGAGGMGAVYEAAHTEIGKRVAIKVLSPTIVALPGARARFLREAQLTSRVRHPNIVDVTDMGSDAGQTYLVMEFLRGEDLGQLLGRAGPFPAQQLTDIMLPVCSAVVEAHKAGVTHRDLKPQNIFLAVGPHTTQPKVLDFGISKGTDIVGAETLTGTGTVIGTPFYLAPEQIVDARTAGPASDQYALGVIMYECLTGHRPFEAENLYVVFQAIVGGHPVPPSQRRPGIPAALEAVVLRAMSVDPNARFASTVALGRALLPFASPRTRSIWEEAFSVVGDVQPGAPLSVPPAASGRQSESASAAPPGAVPLLTPGPSRGRGSGGVHTPMAAERDRVVEAPRLSSGPHSWGTRESFSNQSVVDLRVRRSRAGKTAAILGIVVVAGLIGGVALRTFRAAPPAGAHAGGPGMDESQPAAARPAAPPAAPAAAGGPIGPKSGPAGAALGAAIAQKGPAEEIPGPRTFSVSVRVQPETAALELDGRPVGQAHFEGALPEDHARHKLRVTADGYDAQEVEFTDEPPPRVLKLARTRRAVGGRDGAGGGAGPRPTRPSRHTRPSLPPVPARMLNPNGAPVID